MATITLDASLKEVLDSLDLDKVPEKLRCSNCHNLNLSPYKTSCCDVYICESCFNDHRNSSCPKCDHKPFTDEICKPNKGMQKTVKTWLKNQEKTKSDGQDKTDIREDSAPQPNTGKPIVNGDGQAGVNVNGEAVMEDRSLLVDTVESEEIPVADLQPSIEEPDHDVFDNDDDIEFQVELDDDEHQELPIQRPKSTEDTPQPQSAKPFETQLQPQDQSNTNNGFDAMNSADFSNNMGGINNSNMDVNQMQQMMQMMQANMQNGMQSGMPFSPMMMTMMSNVNQMSGMLGGFGGQNGGMNMNGMNGMNMNMGMNFNPNQGMYGWNGQNNDMWQNNNANAFPNGMGSDFSSNYGFNMNQSGNFQQNYPSGDFQNGSYNGRGYGRGRGRGRGGFGRGRGNFNQYSQYPQQPQGYQNSNNPGPRQFDNRNVQSQTVHNDRAAQLAHHDRADKHEMADESHEDDEFAPGGQEEVQEALGEDYQKSHVVTEVATSEIAVAADVNGTEEPEPAEQDDTPDLDKVTELAVKDEPQAVKQEVSEPVIAAGPEKTIPDAYNEDLQGSMAPPSAPTGPSAKFGDYGFRSRGHGRFSSRGRDSMSMQNGHITSPVKPFSPAPPPTEPKGSGVVGAPTGPRAMREPAAPTRPLSRSAAAGFQIMGRASLAVSSRSESRDVDRRHSKSPDRDSRDLSRRPSKQEKYSSSKYDADEQDEPDYREDKRSRKPSKRDTYDDYDRDGQESSYPRSESADYKSSSRRSRNEKDRQSKHSSRSRRHLDEDTNDDHEMDDYEDSGRSGRDAYGESRSKHRSSKSSKYEDRDRERDRDRDRDKDREKPREKDRDKDREREDRHREREREHRKRSRHDRHREDDGTGDYDYEQQEEAEESESRHHSRRHKKEHRPARDTSEYNGTSTSQPSGRPQSHRSSANATPAPPSTTSTPVEEKDMYTNERERLAQARLLAEKQRRAKQASTRTSNPKYEDELPRDLVEGERARHRGGRGGR